MINIGFRMEHGTCKAIILLGCWRVRRAPPHYPETPRPDRGDMAGRGPPWGAPEGRLEKVMAEYKEASPPQGELSNKGGDCQALVSERAAMWGGRL